MQPINNIGNTIELSLVVTKNYRPIIFAKLTALSLQNQLITNTSKLFLKIARNNTQNMFYNMFFCTIFVRFLKNQAFISFNLLTKMRKLILLVAIATTMSFAACTNTSTTEQPEEAAVENAEVAMEETVATVDTTTQVVAEEEAATLVETLD